MRRRQYGRRQEHVEATQFRSLLVGRRKGFRAATPSELRVLIGTVTWGSSCLATPGWMIQIPSGLGEGLSQYGIANWSFEFTGQEAG